MLFPGLVIGPVIFSFEFLVHRGEVDNVRTDLDRVQALVDDRLHQLDSALRDYAVWDDTYAFTQRENPQYVEDNFYPESMMNIGVQTFIALDRQGELVFAGQLDAEQDALLPAQETAQQIMQGNPTLIPAGGIPDPQRGLIAAGEQVFLLAARPVVPSSSDAPPSGALLFALPTDGHFTEAISHLAQRNVSITAIEANTSPNTESLSRVNNNIISGSRVLLGIDGRPAARLTVDIPRTLYKNGSTALFTFNAFITMFALTLFLGARPLTLNYLATRRENAEAMERFRAVVEQSSEAILLVDRSWRILDANRASMRLLALDEDRSIPYTLLGILTFRPQLPANFLDTISTGSHAVEQHCTTRAGAALDLEISASRINTQGSSAYSLILRDVTERKITEHALRTSQERFQLAARGANDGIWDWNLMTGQIYFSTRWKAMLGLDGEPYFSHPEDWFNRIHPDDRIPFQAAITSHLKGQSDQFMQEARMLHADGTYRWMLARGVAAWSNTPSTSTRPWAPVNNAASGSAAPGSAAPGSAGADRLGAEDHIAYRMAGSLTDITRQKAIEAQLRHDALHDPLTGLANRTLLLDRLRHVNERMRRRPGLHYALFFLDFDRFKQINDLLGHQSGDALLMEAARRLNAGLRTEDTVSRYAGPETVARIAGDEFVLLLEDLHDPADALCVAERVNMLLEQPMKLAGKEVRASVSVGIVLPETPYDEPENIIRDADIAMYHAKQKGGATAVIFQPEMYEKTLAHLQLQSELRQGIERGEFDVYYQPIHSLQSDCLMGFEALARWRHPTRGLLPARLFIDAAEETGLIIPIGYSVMRQACQQMRAWQLKFSTAEALSISVNLSTRQASSSDLARRVQDILAETGLEPGSLRLEITESALIQNLPVMQAQLETLRSMGIGVEIDDFGTGYSSFSYLKNLPVDGFKIDRSFISDLDTNGQQIIKSLVTLGHDLGITQVAEGVETKEQRDTLRALDCDYVQGYLISYPVDADAVERHLRNNDSAPWPVTPSLPQG
jgi:diguanylate cyclase (GGDEF)-like protein/PAS domain S-box-containing protein